MGIERPKEKQMGEVQLMEQSKHVSMQFTNLHRHGPWTTKTITIAI